MFRVSSFSDIAGQVTASSVNADRVTVGSVYLSTERLEAIREVIPRPFPKWRDANDADLEYITSLIARESLSITVASIDKTTALWRAFWEDASDTHSKASSLQGGPIGFLKAATLIKFVAFGHASAAGMAHAIVTGQIPRPKERGGLIEIEEAVVLDNEIQGQDNIEALVDIWRAINSHQPMSNSLGISRLAVSLRLATEQSEPLLLLADYAAGIVQAVRSKVNVLSKSKVSPEAAATALARMSQSGRLLDFTDTVRLSYFEIYPDFAKFSRRHVA